MRELGVQASSSTLNDTNRESAAAEFNQLRTEIDRIAQATAYNGETLLTGFGTSVGAASTAVTTSSTTGVVNVSLAAVQAGTYAFEDAAGDGNLTLGNGAVTQTLNTGILLDGSAVESGATAVVNFDRLGIQITLSGAGVAGATGDYEDGDLNNATLVIEGGTGGVFQVGPRADVVNRIEIGIGDLRASGSALNMADLSLNSLTTARGSLAVLDEAVNTVSNERGKLGSVQNRLLFTMAYTENEIESIQSSEASIRDADVAEEVSTFSRASILLRSSNAMLVQSNVTSFSALQLL
jgi:flagellin